MSDMPIRMLYEPHIKVGEECALMVEVETQVSEVFSNLTLDITLRCDPVMVEIVEDAWLRHLVLSGGVERVEYCLCGVSEGVAELILEMYWGNRWLCKLSAPIEVHPTTS